MSADSNGGRVPDEFWHHLSGLVDGEGHFAIAKQVKVRTGSTSYGVAFKMNLRDDDTAVLEMIHERTGLGVLYTSVKKNDRKHFRDAKPMTMWCVQTKRECLELVAIFERFPLWTKKARDFHIWAKAVRYLNGSKPEGWEPMAHWFEEIRAVRQYDAPMPLDESYDLDAQPLWEDEE